MPIGRAQFLSGVAGSSCSLRLFLRSPWGSAFHRSREPRSPLTCCAVLLYFSSSRPEEPDYRAQSTAKGVMRDITVCHKPHSPQISPPFHAYCLRSAGHVRSLLPPNARHGPRSPLATNSVLSVRILQYQPHSNRINSKYLSSVGFRHRQGLTEPLPIAPVWFSTF